MEFFCKKELALLGKCWYVCEYGNIQGKESGVEQAF
jgi:hypothetical protein